MVLGANAASLHMVFPPLSPYSTQESTYTVMPKRCVNVERFQLAVDQAFQSGYTPTKISNDMLLTPLLVLLAQVL
jgi:galactitol-specific phosphotransferase system IIC component